LWYQAYTGDRLSERTQDCAVCYAESDDGIHFTKPMLDFYPFEDHQETNIVMVGNGGYSYRYGNAVGGSGRGRRLEAIQDELFRLGCETDGDEYPGLHVAFSPDGVHWRKHETGPLSKMAYGKGEFGVDVPHTDGTSEPWLIPLSMSAAVDSMWEKAPVSTVAFEGARVRSCRRRC
tara:strand:+ start:506 stop:1033 length:528 start_codon:yes stop_codon:yes gene_type:complete